ncbi:Deoxyribonuclease TatD-related protein [Lasiodiplodia theobromae]|uniref:Cut9-interacting protein scn1 n=1 Tax=Lasiodiplodia theobromae TaxID=45133 RepID=A0A5N5CYH9_9PEZI|nr:Deoxyribonuclease TatD-related protein [Lasiodiplodia theobromae]KAB2570401.1 Cut9-interacting protein scn1 [Lasiodiplodia theobromae]KAF4543047.1 Deoxyribonuclease TatD-related protein [Lasiodiplodia theobromae]
MDGSTPFPWHIGVFDAHCHPTDTMSAVPAVPHMKAKALTVMATRAQDQQLVADVADRLGVPSPDVDSWNSDECVLPCFGWHPWFSHQMCSEDRFAGKPTLDDEAKIVHYRGVLSPPPEDRDFILSLPDPRPFSEFLDQARRFLCRYPLALVGEIGLDKSFRIPKAWHPETHENRDDSLTPGGREGRGLTAHVVAMDHQRKIFTAQLNLAGEMRRAVSVHGVQAHGVLFETIRATWKGYEKKPMSRRERKKRGVTAEEADEDANAEDDSPKPFPPRICLHSYSGHPSTLPQYFDPSVPSEVFVSFSTAINYSDRAAQTTSQSIKAVPDDRILVESDLHIAGELMDKHLEDIVRVVCGVKEWGLEEGTRKLRQNWEHFAFGRRKKDVP